MDIRDFIPSDMDGYITMELDNYMPHFSWANQVRQYPQKGKSGFSYFAGILDSNRTVDCLLFRNKEGELVGILNHYPFTDEANDIKKGDIAFFVKPSERSKGIGKKLLAEGIKRWSFDLKQQVWTLSGTRCLMSFLKHKQT